ncbi:MAG: hypothetical protein AAFR93_12260, partial [Pseudomonadota bacterium]
MTIMTALVLIIAIGAIVQGTSEGNSIFGGSKAFKAKDDTFSIRAGRTVTLDVLLNDANADTLEPGSLTLVGQPQCGVAEVIGDAIQYNSPPSCSGQQTLTYCVPTTDSCELATVTLAVLQVAPAPAEVPVAANTPAPSTEFRSDLPQLGENMEGERQTAALPQTDTAPTRPATSRPAQPTTLPQADARPAAQTPTRPVVSQPGQEQTGQTQTAQRNETARPATAASAAPTVFADVVQGSAPQSLPQVSMRAPTRLSAPSSIEMITPSEATAGIRRDAPGQQAGGTQVAGVSDQTVVISRDSARSGAVDSSGFSMSAPSVETETSSGIRLSGLQPSTAPRPSVSVQQIGSVAQPQGEQPARIEVGPAVFTDAPVQLASLAVDDQIAAMRRPIASMGLSNVEFVTATLLQEPLAAPTGSAPDADSAPRPNGILGVSDSLALVDAEQSQGLSLPNRFQLAPAREPVIELASVQPSADVFQRRAEPESHTTITVSQDVQEVETPREAFLVGNPDFIIERNDPIDEVPAAPERAPEETFEPVETASLNINATDPGTSAPRPVIDVEVGTASSAVTLPSNDVPFALPTVGQDAAIETAALTSPTRFDPAAPADAPPTTAAQSCDPSFVVTPGPGAELDAELYTPCRPDEIFTVRHETLAFTAKTDSAGRAFFTVPAFFEQAQVSVLFDQGRPLSASTVVTDLNRVTRVAIVWSGDADMNLRAREYGA